MSDSEHQSDSESEVEVENKSDDSKDKKESHIVDYEQMIEKLENDIVTMISLTDDYSKRTDLYHENTNRLEECEKIIKSYEHIIKNPEEFIEFIEDEKEEFSLPDTLKKIEESKNNIVNNIDHIDIDELMRIYLNINKWGKLCKQ